MRLPLWPKIRLAAPSSSWRLTRGAARGRRAASSRLTATTRHRSCVAPTSRVTSWRSRSRLTPWVIGAGLEALRVPGDVAAGAGHRVDPARAGLAASDGVEADAGDDHEDVAGVGVDRDPLALA